MYKRQVLYELPALRDDSWNEDEPVSGVRIDASPGKPDFFAASPGTSRTASLRWLVIVIDEFSCAREPAAKTYLRRPRHVTLEVCCLCDGGPGNTQQQQHSSQQQSSTATSQQQQKLKLLLQQQLCCTL